MIEWMLSIIGINLHDPYAIAYGHGHQGSISEIWLWLYLIALKLYLPAWKGNSK